MIFRHRLRECRGAGSDIARGVERLCGGYGRWQVGVEDAMDGEIVELGFFACDGWRGVHEIGLYCLVALFCRCWGAVVGSDVSVDQGDKHISELFSGTNWELAPGSWRCG